MSEDQKISSLEEFTERILKEYTMWNTKHFPWFRGEPESKQPLLPRLYREGHNENQLLQLFRIKAPALGIVPPRSEHTEQWLFLAQHFRLPTRLLDWTESALVALFFALQMEVPIVWMLNPVALNCLSNPGSSPEQQPENAFPLPWVKYNMVNENIRGAWELDERGVDLPVAVPPTCVHLRMIAQKSCFTVQGKKKDSLCNLVDEKVLKKFEINGTVRKDMLFKLRILGISELSVFPDFEGLARDLEKQF